MALASTHPRLTFREDDLFFSAMATVALVVMLVGFARTYFLAGLFWAPLPSLLVHIHAAAFILWIVLLITQISLVTARRVDLWGLGAPAHAIIALRGEGNGPPPQAGSGRCPALMGAGECAREGFAER